MQRRGGELAQWLKYLLSKRENVNPVPSACLKFSSEGQEVGEY